MITKRVDIDKLPNRGCNSYICTIQGRITHIPFKSVTYLNKLDLYLDVDFDFVFTNLYWLISKEIKLENEFEFLNDYNIPVHELFEPFRIYKNKPKISTSEPKLKDNRKGYKCCYCEIELTPENYTREHVIPKRVGGKIIRPCCKDCNSEKGGLMLKSYIQLLNFKLLEEKGHPFIILQTKIKNANKIDEEIESKIIF